MSAFPSVERAYWEWQQCPPGERNHEFFMRFEIGTSLTNPLIFSD